MQRFVIAAGLLLVATSEVAAQNPQQSNAGSGAPVVSNALVVHVDNVNGYPVRRAFVTLLEARASARESNPGSNPPDLQPVNMPLGTATNEDGEFQFTQLPPGNYFVLVHPPDTPPGELRRDSLYEPTYYPGTSKASEAKPVAIGPTDRVTVTITLARLRTFTISGDATSLKGETFYRGVLRVVPAATPTLLTRGYAIDADGSFLVRDVRPGTYCLRAMDGVWPPRDVARTAFARVTVDGDVTGIRVAAIEMVKITGRVIADAATRDRMATSPVRIAASLKASNCIYSGVQISSAIRKDLTFEFQTWPGTGSVVVLQGRMEDVSTTVRLNGRDVTGQELEFREGQNISGLEVVIERVLAH